MIKSNELIINLHLFDGAGSAAGSGTSAGAGDGANTGANGSAAGSNTGDNAGSKETAAQRSDKGQAAAGKITVDVGSDVASRFDELIKGEYKDEFAKRTSDIVQKRLGEAKTAKEQLDKLSPMLKLLSDKYQVDAKDTEKLLKAIESDDSLYVDEAMRRGMSVEQLKEFKRMELENESLRKAQSEKTRQEAIQRDVERWIKESDDLKQIYPSFDLQAEIDASPDFMGLLKNGIPVRTAYEVMHKDEIIAGAMQYTAQQVAQKTAQGLASKQERPSENGVHNQPAVATKIDISKLSKKECADLERRAARGERITLR